MAVYALVGGDRQSRGERRDRLRAKRRELNLRRWLRKGDRRGPLPDIGIVCPRCRYQLTGLTGETCPECGSPVDFEAIATMERGNAGSVLRK